MLAKVALSFLLLTCIALAKDDVRSNVNDAVNEVANTKDGATWCPVPLVGTACPSSSIFHYYKCCGDLLKDCCFNLQVWVIVVLAVIVVITLASFVLSVLRCLFCRK